MARPTTKSDLILTANTQFTTLWNLIDSLSPESQESPFIFQLKASDKEAHWKRDQNVRDILTHLYEWHQLLLNWVKSNETGDPKPFLPPPYNWKTYGQMNIGFYECHQNTSYIMSKTLLMKSHDEVIQLIDGFSNNQLFEKKQFSWTGTTTLGSYCTSATASHYNWAIKKIKRHKESFS